MEPSGLKGTVYVTSDTIFFPTCYTTQQSMYHETQDWIMYKDGDFQHTDIKFNESDLNVIGATPISTDELFILANTIRGRNEVKDT